MKQIFTFALVAAMATSACAQGVDQGRKNAPQFSPAWPNQTRADAQDSGLSMQMEVLAEGLDTPWGVEALPEGGLSGDRKIGRFTSGARRPSQRAS